MTKFNDITGNKIGSWTIVEKDSDYRTRKRWLCKCDCGTVKSYTTAGIALFTEGSSCGCLKGNKIKVGDIGTSNKGFPYVVKEVNGCNDILIEFQQPRKCDVKTTAHYIRTGVIKNPYELTQAGAGYMGQGKYNCSEHREFNERWSCMFKRVVLQKHKIANISYLDATICDAWHNFQNFAEWMESQIIGGTDWHLEKDLLAKGNKVYSPETCVFVPMEINMVLTRRKACRGNTPIGVHYRAKTNRYLSQYTRGAKQVFLGSFATPEGAFGAYKESKEEYLKYLAAKWQSQIDPRAYEALMNYTVEITD